MNQCTVKCDECKKEIRKTANVSESYALRRIQDISDSIDRGFTSFREGLFRIKKIIESLEEAPKMSVTDLE